MGRKSKRRGKSKRGGKQRSPNSGNTAEIINPFSSMTLAQEESVALRGDNTEQVPELKTQIDEFVEEATSATDPDDDDVRDHFITLTSLKRKFMVEFADMFFGDRGAEFRMRYTEAADKALALMEKMKKDGYDGDTDDQLRLVKDTLFTMNKLLDEKFKDRGMDSPFAAQLEEPFYNTKFDHELFQPCPPRPDCPICFIPLPSQIDCTYQSCCGQVLCDGCIIAQQYANDASHSEFCCPFCRESLGVPVSEHIKRTEKRMKIGDCQAFSKLGGCYLRGMPPFKQNHKKGLELLNQAAEFGSEVAHHTLGMAYANGLGVKKDNQKALYHLRLAAIGGVLESRYFLGGGYLQGDPNLAYKHFIIAAEAGHDKSLKEVKTGYAEGHVEKDVLEKVLRAHQAAKDAVKSEARGNADSRRRQDGSGRYNPRTQVLVRDL